MEYEFYILTDGTSSFPIAWSETEELSSESTRGLWDFYEEEVSLEERRKEYFPFLE